MHAFPADQGAINAFPSHEIEQKEYVRIIRGRALAILLGARRPAQKNPARISGRA
jgi:hypothetical protein